MFSACELLVSGVQFYTESCIFGSAELGWGGYSAFWFKCVVNTSKPLEVAASLYIFIFLVLNKCNLFSRIQWQNQYNRSQRAIL